MLLGRSPFTTPRLTRPCARWVAFAACLLVGVVSAPAGAHAAPAPVVDSVGPPPEILRPGPGQRVELIYRGLRGLLPTRIEIPDPETVEEIYLEVVYDGKLPSPTLHRAMRVRTGGGREVQLEPRLITGSWGSRGTGTFSGLLGRVDRANLDFEVEEGSAQAALLYVLRRDGNPGSFQVAAHVGARGSAGNQTFTVPLPEDDDRNKDVVVTLPLSAVSADGGSLDFLVKAGGRLRAFRRTWSADFAYDNECCVDTVQARLTDVDGAVKEIEVTVISPDKGPAESKSYVVAGLLQADVRAQCEILGLAVPTAICIDNTMRFAADAAGRGYAANWDFGEGATPRTFNGLGEIFVVFDEPGEQVVTVEVLGPDCRAFERHVLKVESCSESTCAVEGATVVQSPANGNDDGVIELDMCVTCGSTPPYRAFYTLDGEEVEVGPLDEQRPKLRGLRAGTYSNFYVVDAKGCRTNVTGPVTLCQGGCDDFAACPSGGCVLTGFNERGSKRALWLPGLAEGDERWRIADDGQARFAVTGNGTARITARVVSYADPSQGLEVEIGLRNRMGWSDWSKQGRSWKGSRRRVNANQHELWDYYELDATTSRMTGFGSLTGTLFLEARQADHTYGVQVGEGANDQNLSPGISAWFAYSGSLNGEQVSGQGDLNVEGTCRLADLERYSAPLLACAPDWSIGCDAELDNAPRPTVNCGAASAYTLTYEDVRIGKRPVTIERTWTARGPAGEATCVQRLTFSDDSAPVFTSVPEDATVSCGELLTMDVEVADDCGEVTVDLRESRSDESCAGSYDLHRVWTATDANGNTATHKAILRVRDQTPPVFAAAPRDVVLECGADLPEDYPSVVDDCGGVVDTEYEKTECEPGVPLYHWTDAGLEYVVEGPDPGFRYPGGMLPVGLSAECSDRPAERRRWRLDNPNGFEVYVDEVRAGGEVIYEGVTLPAATSVYLFTPGSGGAEVAWRDGGGQARAAAAESSAEACPLTDAETCTCVVTRRWTATDDCGNAATHEQKIYFRDTKAPILRGLPADMTYRTAAEVPAAAPVTADDACGDAVANLREFQIPSSEYGCDEAAVHYLFGARAASAPVLDLGGRAFLMADGPLAVRELCDGTAVVEGEIADAIRPNERFAVELRFEGRRGYEEHAAAGGASPASCGLSDKADWRFYRVAAGGRLRGRGALEGTELAISAVGDERLQIGPGANGVNCRRGMFGRFAYAAAAGAYPGGTGQLRGSAASVAFDAAGACASSYTLVRLYTAVDGCGNLAVERQVLRVNDFAGPSFERVPENVLLACGDELPVGEPKATDLSDAKVDLALDERREAVDCGELVTRTWTASDDCGNTATVSQLITVRDDEAPALTFADPRLAALASGDVLVVSCADVPALEASTATATDGCDPAPTVNFATEKLGGGDCAELGYSERSRCTWTAADACGNATTFSVYVELRDEAGPVLADVPADVALSCAAPFPTTAPVATDDCAAEVTLTESTRRLVDDCADSYRVVRTWTATDDCGNTATASQTVTVTDDVAPVLADVPADVTLACTDALPTALPVATDDCDADVGLAETVETRPGACANGYDLVRTFTATDNCGNVATATQVVRVRDEAAPVLALVGGAANGLADGAALRLTCGESVAFSAADAVATDDCDARVDVSYAEADARLGSCPDDGFARAFTAVWSAVDACGNAAELRVAVTIVDEAAPVIANVPAAVAIACGQAVPTDQPTVSDGCTPTNELVVAEASTRRDGACANGYEIVRTWTATDACGNVATASQLVTVTDDTRPTLAAIPESVTVGCDAALPTDLPTATDDCDAAVAVSFADVEQPGACPSSYSLLRTFTATDACGNTATANQVITVRDLTAPTFASVPAAVSVTCAEGLPADQPAVSDACDADVAVVETTQRRPGACPSAYELVRTWTATDACGNAATASQVVTVTDDVAPVFADVPAATTVRCSDPLPSLQPTASDDCSSEVNVAETRETRPGACPNGYELVRTFTATDACGNVATAQQVVTVVDDTAPLIAGTPANVMLACDEPLPTAQPTASDDCDGAVAVVETQLTEEGQCPGGYVLFRTFTATDACGNVATAQQVVTVEDRVAPTFSYVPGPLTLGCAEPLPTEPAAAADNCDGAVEITERQDRRDGACPGTYDLVRVFTATDACGNAATAEQVVTYTDEVAPVLAGVPASLTVGCADEVPGAAPTATDNCDEAPVVALDERRQPGGCEASYRIVRVWTATDHCGNAATASQVVTVEDREAPVFASVPPAVVVACSQALPDDVAVATDACDAEVAVTEDQRVEPGECADAYRVIRVWTATDACGNAATASQVVTVEDREAPAFADVPASLTVTCNEPLPSVGPRVTDNCDERVSLTETQDVRPGACDDSYEVVRTWTATDACGNVATASQTVSVVDDRAPEFTFVPAAVTVGCDAALPTDQPDVVDACDAAVALVETEERRAGACAGAYEVIRTWTATDACGNVATASQVVSVSDVEAPVFAGVPAATVVGCDAELPVSAPTARDACDGDVAVVEAQATEPGDCPGTYTVVRTWTAVDDCGNAATAQQRVLVEDREAPTFTSVPASLTLGCDEALPTDLPSATDACDDEVAIGEAQERRPGTCPGSYQVVRTFTATDDCGNAATASQVVTFRDDVAPVFADVPAAVSVACDAALPTDLPTAADACDADVEIAEEQRTEPGNCADAYVVVRLWTATDDCGNTATASQLVTVVDEEAPAFASVPAEVTIECGADLPADLAAATDNCDDEVDVTVVEKVVPGACAGTYAVRRVFTATDNCGNTATAEQRVNVVDTQAPTFAEVPAATTISCGEAVPTVLAKADDACDADVLVSVSETTEPGACAGSYTVVRTFTATDDCGNAATAEQRVSVVDGEAPTFASVPADATVGCEGGVPTDAAVATDACDAQVTVTEEHRTEPGACAGAGVVIRVWTATDACGNVATASQVVTFRDEAAPELVSVPDSVTIGCGQPLPVDLPVARDACDPEVAVAVTEASEPGACPGASTVVRTFTATDACGNASTASQVVTVRDETAPTFADVPPSVTVTCEEPLPQTRPLASDDCDDAVRVEESQEIEPGLCGSSYRVIRTWTATDACGNAATASQVVRVQDVTAPTFVSVPADAELTCADAFPTELPAATDACDDDVHVAEQQQRLPGGCASSYTLVRRFTATDACGNTATAEQRITVTDSGGPTLVGLPADVTIGCADTLPTARPTATDACDDEVAITESRERVDGACPGDYRVVRTWTATDDCGNTAVGTQTVTVRDDRAPVFADVPAARELACGELVPTDRPTAADDCDANVEIVETQQTLPGACANETAVVRTWTATDDCGNVATATQRVDFRDEAAPTLQSVPADVVIACDDAFPTTLPRATDGCGGEVTIEERTSRAKGACPDGYAVTRTWIATDVCGNTATATQLVTVEDRVAPVFANVPGPATITCGEDLPGGEPTATDNCDDQVKVRDAEERVDGACGNNYEIVRTWTATDDCGNRATVSQVITVVDPVAPTLASVPAAVTVSCSDGLPGGKPRASDNCGRDVTLAEAQAIVPGACPDAYDVVRTWTATDGCGNTATASQRVTVVDDVAPVFSKVPPSRTVACGEQPREEAPVAKDDCDDAVEVTLVETTTAAACASGVEVLRVWTAVDNCGNRATASQTIRFEDRRAPVIAGVEKTVRVPCDQPVPVIYPTATDGCDRDVRLEYFDAEQPGRCRPDIRRTWVATDACGNSASTVQTIVIVDDVEPVLAGVPSDQTLGCGEPVAAAVVTATDNCGGELAVRATEVESEGRCPGERVLTREWAAEDACGNRAVGRQVITIVPSGAPALAGVPADLTLGCGEAVPTGMPTATPSCGGLGGAAEVTVAERREVGACAGSYRVIRTFTATDACGNAATAQQTVTFADDAAPAIAGVPADATVTCGDALPAAAPTATDDCDAEVDLRLAERTVAGGCENAYAVVRTWTATDDCGNVATATQTVTVVDEAAPTLVDVPADVTITCGEPIPAAAVRATDGCTADASVLVALEEVREDGAAAGDYRLVRTWTATDACGNVATARQVVSVTATGAPTFTFVPDDLALECGDDVPEAQATAVGGCDGEAVVTLAEERERGACANAYVIVRTWTARTSNGNTATARQRIELSDRTAPVLTSVPADVTLGCSGAVPTEVATAVDDCGGEVVVTVDEQRRPGECSSGSEVVRTFTATDACGNAATATQVVRFGDTEPPVFTSVPGGVEFECSVGQPRERARATDNCTPNVRVTYEDLVGVTDCSERLHRVWTATDDCGNTATAVQQILLSDTEDPVLSNVPRDVTVDVSSGRAVPDAPRVQVRDNCGQAPTLDFEERREATVGCDYVLVRTWTATDACGNTARSTQRVTVSGVAPKDCDRREQPLATTPPATAPTTAPRAARVAPAITSACGAEAATMRPVAERVCLERGRALVQARVASVSMLPDGQLAGYVLATSAGGRILATADAPAFDVETPGAYSVHQVVFAATDLDLATLAGQTVTAVAERFAAGDYAPCGAIDGAGARVSVLADGACDAPLAQADATTPPPSPVVATDDRGATTKGAPVTIDVVANDRVAGAAAAVTPVAQPRAGTVEAMPDRRLRYTPRAGFCAAVDSFAYVLTDGAAADTATVRVEVSCDDLVVLSGFSPNGDGLNDRFVVLGIENHPANRVVVFNGEGNEVFSRDAYSNEPGVAFDGKRGGAALPDGTYYYVIALAEGATHSGMVQLRR